MATSDDVVRAQARALLRVLKDYHLDRQFGVPTPLWQAVESFGRNRASAVDLPAIGRKYAGTAAAAFWGGVRHQAPNAALYLALSSFTRASPAYRLLDASRWIALCFAFRDKKALAESAIQGEILERLEATFAAEINENHARAGAGRAEGLEA
jgi:hypothetical protein